MNRHYYFAHFRYNEKSQRKVEAEKLRTGFRRENTCSRIQTECRFSEAPVARGLGPILGYFPIILSLGGNL